MPLPRELVDRISVLAGLIGPVLEVRVGDSSHGALPGSVERLDLHDVPLVFLVVVLLNVMHLLPGLTACSTHGKDAPLAHLELEALPGDY